MTLIVGDGAEFRSFDDHGDSGKRGFATFPHDARDLPRSACVDHDRHAEDGQCEEQPSQGTEPDGHPAVHGTDLLSL
jgi:hypothetical protein